MFFSYKTKYDADEDGHFGIYGGRYAPEMLIPALVELDKVYKLAKKDPKFEKEYFYFLSLAVDNHPSVHKRGLIPGGCGCKSIPMLEFLSGDGDKFLKRKVAR